MKGNPNEKDAFIRLFSNQAPGNFFVLINDQSGRVHFTVDSTTPGQVALDCIRKQTEQSMGSNPVSRTPPQLVFQFLPSGALT